jgi:xylose isomerase
MPDTPTFRFSAGPWNLHPGRDPFGPEVRPERELADKFRILKDLGFDYVQFHDDDAVPDDASAADRERQAKEVRRLLDDMGLQPEFVAPRIWEDPLTIDGAITANDPKCRQYALDRGKRAVDVARALGTDRIVLWPAREGTYIRESKDPIAGFGQMLDFCDTLLAYDPNIRILGEMKPNEPMDLMFLPSTGHFLALAYKTSDPSRVGVLIESAHCILLGIDPSEEMAYAMFHDKLWSVHLNDQDGLKYDQDKAFGSVNLRRAWNQVDLLVRSGYGSKGEVVGLDVKVMRTQPFETAHYHLRNSKETFDLLVEVSHRLDRAEVDRLRAERNYEDLDQLILRTLLNAR